MDTTIQGLSGIMNLTQDGGVPYKTGVSIADIVGGLMGVIAILAALDYRARHGVGQSIDLSMQDASAWMTRTTWTGVDTRPPVALVACSDGWVAADTSSGGAADLIANCRPIARAARPSTR